MMFAPRYTVFHCGYLKGEREISDTPRTDALIHSSLDLSQSTIAEFAQTLERENDTLREQINWLLFELKVAADRLTDCQQTTISARDCIGRVEAALAKGEGK